MSLHAFFDAMGPMLSGRTSAAEVEAELGATSPSGTENLGFYAVLVERNHFKILRDLFGPIRTLALRRSDTLWGRLVRDYTRKHPAGHWDPNRFGASFSEYLANLRQRHGELPTLFEELADYLYIRHLAYSSPDEPGDGFETRLFVRQYSHAVPDVLDALARDPEADLPGAKPIVVIVYRHARHRELRTFYPSAAGLGALARRQGVDSMPEMFKALPAQTLDAAEANLVEHGVLTPPKLSPTD